MELSKVLAAFALDGAEATPFLSEEDGEEYRVWKVTAHDETLVLKEAKGEELRIYEAYLREETSAVPHFLGKVNVDGTVFFLMEYVEGETLCRCSRNALTAALDALIALQDRWWERREMVAGLSYEKSLEGRVCRGRFLNDPVLEAVYEKFLADYEAVPRTLCHDDLLPFNVLKGEGRAVIIDWERAGILPYAASLARLIAHGTEEEEALFFLTGEDRDFAIDYYYENLIRHKGISREEYCRTLDLFLFYEYCEWIMLGNRYPDADMERFQIYLEKARGHIAERNLI